MILLLQPGIRKGIFPMSSPMPWRPHRVARQAVPLYEESAAHRSGGSPWLQYAGKAIRLWCAFWGYCMWERRQAQSF